MNYSRDPKFFLVNVCLFGILLITFLLDTGISLLFIIIGFFINTFFFLKRASHGKPPIDPQKESQPEPDISEKNMIMEDLDREVTRRRESEQLSKN